jgi:hypothetical protein
MKRKDWARSPPTTRNIPELGISESIPLTEYFPFRVRTPNGARETTSEPRGRHATGLLIPVSAPLLPNTQLGNRARVMVPVVVKRFHYTPRRITHLKRFPK